MITVIFGRRGTGKTEFCKRIVKKSIIPVVVIDTMNEYENLAVKMRIADDIRFDKYKIRFVPEDHLEFAIVNRALSGVHYKYGLNVIVDEVDMWTNPHFMPKEFWNNIRYSRHYRLNFYITVRNPNELHKSISGLADKFIIFRITEPRYLDYFKQYCDHLPNLIRALPKYYYKEYKV